MLTQVLTSSSVHVTAYRWCQLMWISCAIIALVQQQQLLLINLMMYQNVPLKGIEIWAKNLILTQNSNSNVYVCDPDLRSAAAAFRWCQIICVNIKVKLVTYKKVLWMDIRKIMNIKLDKGKSHSLIAVGALGVRVPLYLGHSWWKAEPIPLLSLP